MKSINVSICVVALAVAGVFVFSAFAERQQLPGSERSEGKIYQLSDEWERSGAEFGQFVERFNVQASKDAIYLPLEESEELAFKPHGHDRFNLERGTRYTLRVTSGRAYYKLPAGGVNTDMVAGMTVMYCEIDEQGRPAVKQRVLVADQSVTFTTPSTFDSCVLVFFLDPFPGDGIVGGYTVRLYKNEKAAIEESELLEKRVEKLEEDVKKLREQLEKR